MKNFTKKLAILCLSLATCATVGATAGCERVEGIVNGLGGAYEELTHQHEYTMDKHNATEHWTECACGEKADIEAHAGGTATCTEQAECTVCGTAYGKLKAHSYLILKNDAKNHWYECACGAKDKVEGHKGGTATYNQQAECTVCGEAYGAFADAQPYALTINNYAPLAENSTYTETILEGATVETQAPQNQEGLTFLYFVDEAGEVVKALPETMPSANVTLTAVWEAKTYTVTISYPAETGVEATVIQFAAFENEGIVALADIAEVVEAAIADETEDYTFAWAEELPAEYELKNYEFNVAATNKKATLTIENYYPLAEEADLTVNILKGATIEVAPVEVPVGYKFLGFMNAEGEMVEIPETMPEEGLTVTAVWESTTYTVIVNYPAEAEKETIAIPFAMKPEWAEYDSVAAPEELAELIKAAVPAANKAFTFALAEELPAEFGPQDYEFSVSYKVVPYKVNFSYPTGYYGTKQASVTFGVYTDTENGVKYDVNTIAEFVAAWKETFPVQETFYEFTTVGADEIPTTFELQNYTFQVEQGKQIGWLDEKATELVVGQPYKMSVYQKNLKQTLYSTGVLSGYYGASTQNFDAGATFYVEEAEGGYYLYFMKGETKTYVNLEQSGNYVNIKYQTTAKSVWTMNATYDTLTTKIGGTDYYMGTYNNFNTFSASKLSYAATSFVSNLYSAEVLNFDPAITEFDVVFNSNGGSEVETQSVLYNTPAAEPEAKPTLAGKNFAGWYEDAECTVEYDFTKPVKGEMTLYAGWADVIYYEVTYVTNGGSAVAAELVEEGKAFTKPEDPTYQFHTFLGWYTDEACTVAYDFATVATSDITLYAAWEVKYMTHAEYLATAAGKAVLVKGYVAYIEGNNIILQDEDGNGYYLYGKAASGFVVGDEISVKGTLDIYNNLYEVKNYTATKTGATKAITPIDYTEALAENGFKVTKELQNKYVTFTGTMTADNEITVGNTKVTLYYKNSSIVKPVIGATVKATAVMSVFYENSQMVFYGTKGLETIYDDATKVAIEKAALKLETEVTEATTLTLPTAGTTYQNVVIAWTLAETTAATLTGNTLTIAAMPAETTTIKLTAAISLSEVEGTKEFTITLKVVTGEEPQIVTESLTIKATTGVLNGKSISWTGTNFVLTNNQDKSTSAIRTSDSDHFRAYAYSQLVVSAKNGKKITKIVITCTGGTKYVTALKDSVGSAATVSGSVVTITLDGTASEWKCSMGAQTRFNKIEVTCQ